jgi:hypothetical protein
MKYVSITALSEKKQQKENEVVDKEQGRSTFIAFF